MMVNWNGSVRLVIFLCSYTSWPQDFTWSVQFVDRLRQVSLTLLSFLFDIEIFLIRSSHSTLHSVQYLVTYHWTTPRSCWPFLMCDHFSSPHKIKSGLKITHASWMSHCSIILSSLSRPRILLLNRKVDPPSLLVLLMLGGCLRESADRIISVSAEATSVRTPWHGD